jgi:hypothetical protein
MAPAAVIDRLVPQQAAAQLLANRLVFGQLYNVDMNYKIGPSCGPSTSTWMMQPSSVLISGILVLPFCDSPSTLFSRCARR